MKPSHAATARRHLDSRLAPLRDGSVFSRPGRGWVRAIRDALGITSAELGRRIGVSQAAASKLEKSEADDTISLKTLRAAAAALDCTLVYALVPNKPLDETVRERARAIANEQIARTHHTMALENQALPPKELAEELDRIVDELLRHDLRALWRDIPTAHHRRGQ